MVKFVHEAMTRLEQEVVVADLVSVRMLPSRLDFNLAHCTRYLEMDREAQEAVHRVRRVVLYVCDQVSRNGVFPGAKDNLDRLKAAAVAEIRAAQRSLSRLPANHRARLAAKDSDRRSSHPREHVLAPVSPVS